MKILRLLDQGTLFSVAKARFEALEVVDILNSSPCLGLFKSFSAPKCSVDFVTYDKIPNATENDSRKIGPQRVSISF